MELFPSSGHACPYPGSGGPRAAPRSAETSPLAVLRAASDILEEVRPGDTPTIINDSTLNSKPLALSLTLPLPVPVLCDLEC